MKVRHLLANIVIALIVVLLMLLASYLLGILSILPAIGETFLLTLFLAIPVSALFIYLCPAYIKRYVLYVAYFGISIEIILQAIALFDILPAVSSYYHAPFGRVYWSKEGHGNSVMNRFGWYYPALKLDPQSRKIALIGDSFIQAVQIHPQENVGIALQNLFEFSKQDSLGTEVISLGLSGIGPAQYLELLEYSIEQFSSTTAVIFIFLGNDFRNSSSILQTEFPPSSYTYYEKDDNGNIYLNPGSEPALQRFRNRLRENHDPNFYTFLKTAYSYLMLPQVAQTILGSVRDINNEVSGKPNALAGDMHVDLADIGLDTSIFKAPLNADAEDAVDITIQLLLRCNQHANDNGINLILVTIPTFPKLFFERYPGNFKDWDLRFNGYDFLLPEKRLIEFAQANNISILPMGDYIKRAELTPEDIKTLYINGTGHWSVSGHQFFAEAVYSFLTTNKD